MPLPSMLQSDSFKRLAQGAAVGAAATMIIGFSWGGWSVESTAAKRADEASRTAVVAVLTNNFIELKKVSTYMQGSFVEKGGWATSPGSDKANSAVAQACATMLGNLK
jgi:pimeloyl-ACP methyl ester carboxylesterase